MKRTLLVGLLLAFVVAPAYPCTDFLVKATDGTVVIGRSMEFAMGMDSEVLVYSRGNKVASEMPDGTKGLGWTSKYGYLGVNAMGIKHALVDGINEAGLSVEVLWFTESQHQEPRDNNWVTNAELIHWLLGNFSTVDEVKKELPDLTVVGITLQESGMPLGVHLAVHDVKGNSIVIEFINGEKKIHDNPLGVMTNKPTFDWHMTNLRNYVHLDSTDKGAKEITGLSLVETGSGSGWLGLPGDWTPPSRFVRTVMMVHSADPVIDAAAAVNLAEHILNANDIPTGVVKPAKATDKSMVDYTQWITIKDLANKVLYYRSYQDLALKKIDMKKLNFDPGAETKSLRMEDGSRNVIDVTDKLK